MGLDNGFYIKSKNLDKTAARMSTFIEFAFPYESVYKDKIELVYWRKCWGLRNEINRVLHMSGDGGEMKVDKEDIPAILRIIKKYMVKDYWDLNADSIWEWDNYIDVLIDSYINLTYLYKDWDSYNNELELTWYDSY